MRADFTGGGGGGSFAPPAGGIANALPGVDLPGGDCNFADAGNVGAGPLCATKAFTASGFDLATKNKKIVTQRCAESDPKCYNTVLGRRHNPHAHVLACSLA